MTINITMPALSPTMEEGTLAKWHVKAGDSVSAGDVIAEIETDKATMEVEAVDEGTVGRILVDEGAEGVKVNAVIAVLLEEGESESDIGDVSAPAPEPAKAEAKPEPASSPEPETKPAAEKPSTTSAPKPETGVSRNGRVFASPLARRLAREAKLDVADIKGTGPKGRVVKADVERATSVGDNLMSAKGEAAPAKSGAPAIEYGEDAVTRVPADGMRKVVAARLTEAARDIPHFFLTADIRMDNLLTARQDINDAAPKNKDGKPEYKLSVNDFVLKAWAIALQRVPEANATWDGDAILLHKHSDVAVAVAIPGGLFTPVVRQAELKSLRQISAEVRDLATRARDRKLLPEEYTGGSSAVSNLGMYGVKHFTSIINPPHGTIISIGAAEERVYPENGEIKVGNFMTISVSCDHRSVDGALGAQLMAEFKALMEQPVMMLA